MKSLGKKVAEVKYAHHPCFCRNYAVPKANFAIDKKCKRMKTVVDVDYEWGLICIQRYARMQARTLEAVKEKSICWEDLIMLIRESRDSMDAQRKISERYGVDKFVARTLLDEPLKEDFILDLDEELEYYAKVAIILKSLIRIRD